jgi:thiosulfate dehydrogenase [quinone] large subunit
MSIKEKIMTTNQKRTMQFEDPPLAKILFADTRWAWIWVIPRLYLGYEWVTAGWGKVTNPAWTGSEAGSALSGFLQGAVTQATGAHPNVQGWYASFLQNIILPHAGVWTYLVAYGEFLVGLGLILGCLTGIAAFFGIFMNMNYLLAGAVSTNPILLSIGILIILAWKTAGWWGLDRWVLPALGTPWQAGQLFQAKEQDKLAT